MMGKKGDNQNIDRFSFLRLIAAAAAGAGLFLYGFFKPKDKPLRYVWQIDPKLCERCGRCADNCVLEQSAVRCSHKYEVCGYCDLCFGYFRPDAAQLNEAAENQICPTGAIKRSFIEEPYFEYKIDKSLCIGCSLCVEGCKLFGNGSLYLQVDQQICKNCNSCSIALVCPSQAFKRIHPAKGYLPNV